MRSEHIEKMLNSAIENMLEGLPEALESHVESCWTSQGGTMYTEPRKDSPTMMGGGQERDVM
jgi:hypothetical protein